MTTYPAWALALFAIWDAVLVYRIATTTHLVIGAVFAVALVATMGAFWRGRLTREHLFLTLITQALLSNLLLFIWGAMSH